MRRIWFIIGFVGLMNINLWATELKTEFRDVQPEFIKVNNGLFTGICVELMNLIQKDTGIKFKYSKDFIPTKRIQSDLEKGIIDVHFGLRKTEDREKKYLFGESLYSVGYRVVVRKSDSIEIETLEDIKKLGAKGIVLSNFGTGTTDYLENQVKLTVDDGGKTTEANLIKLESNRGRFFIYYNLGLFYELQKSKLKNKIRILPKTFDSYEHYVVFYKKTSPEIIEKINNSIKKLKKTNEWKNIIDEYTEAK